MAIGDYKGKHYTEWVDEVKTLRRAKNEEAAEALLLELVKAVEAEAKKERWTPAPWYYEQIAIIRSKRKDFAGEVEILERYMKQPFRDDNNAPKMPERLEKARRKPQDAQPLPSAHQTEQRQEPPQTREQPIDSPAPKPNAPTAPAPKPSKTGLVGRLLGRRRS